MLEWLWNADSGLILGALGFVTAIASLVYSRSEVRGSRAQLASTKEQAAEALRAAELVAENAREQATEALRAAEKVAEGAREQAAEALRAAGLVAENARTQAVEALRAASLVAEGAREQATQALLAADLLADAEVSARVRDMRARNFRANPNLPAGIQKIMEAAGGPDAYSVMLDSIDIAQEVFILRQRNLVSDENWRRWMNDQLLLISTSPCFQDIFRREADQGVLLAEFVEAFQPVFEGLRIADPAKDQRAAPERAAEPVEPELATPVVDVDRAAVDTGAGTNGFADAEAGTNGFADATHVRQVLTAPARAGAKLAAAALRDSGEPAADTVTDDGAPQADEDVVVTAAAKAKRSRSAV